MLWSVNVRSSGIGRAQGFIHLCDHPPVIVCVGCSVCRFTFWDEDDDEVVGDMLLLLHVWGTNARRSACGTHPNSTNLRRDAGTVARRTPGFSWTRCGTSLKITLLTFLCSVFSEKCASISEQIGGVAFNILAPRKLRCY